MNLLEKKGLLTINKIGLVNFYSPRKNRQELVKSETHHLIARVFHGSAPALANFLLESEDMNLEEIDKIKKLLGKKEAQLKGEKK